MHIKVGRSRMTRGSTRGYCSLSDTPTARHSTDSHDKGLQVLSRPDRSRGVQVRTWCGGGEEERRGKEGRAVDTNTHLGRLTVPVTMS